MLYAEGETAPKMMSVGLHCRARRPARPRGGADAVSRLCRAHDRVWVPTRLQIAQHWHANMRISPPTRAISDETRCRKNRSPISTPAARRLRRGAGECLRILAVDRRAGVAARGRLPASSTVRGDEGRGRSRAAELRLALIKAHPDLADKTQRAAGLTAESTAEQNSVGLDRLSDAEYRGVRARQQRLPLQIRIPLYRLRSPPHQGFLLRDFETSPAERRDDRNATSPRKSAGSRRSAWTNSLPPKTRCRFRAACRCTRWIPIAASRPLGSPSN